MSAELVALEEAVADSIRRSDPDAAERLLAADYALSSTGGVSSHMSRAEWLAALPQIETRSLEPEVLETQRFGDVAAARLRVRWQASLGERDLSGTYAVSDVFRRENGDWRLAWRISVRLADE